MVSLCLLVDEALSVAKSQKRIGETLVVRGRLYRERLIGPEREVFYDWIVDEHGLVQGLNHRARFSCTVA